MLQREFSGRFKFVFLTFTLLIAIFSFKVWQNVKDHYLTLSARKLALRGNVYDCEGRLIAASEVVYGAYLDVDYLRRVAGGAFRKDPDFLKLLSNFGITEYIGRVNDSRLLKLGVFKSREEIIRKVPTQYLRFVSIEPEEKRVAISDAGLKYILGKAESRTGIGGVEEYFDRVLRPMRDGFITVSYSGFFGNTLSKREEPPQNGQNVTITIDSVLQKYIYERAQRLLTEKQADEVGVLVMETRTGKLRVALSTKDWPTFYMGYLEPGSTIKPIVFAVALEHGVVTPNTKFKANGYIKPLDNSPVVIRDIKPYGEIDLHTGLVHSSNVVAIGTAKSLVEKFGAKKLYEALLSFGFGAPTGIELPGEIPGALRPVERWSKVDWAYVSIGQSIGVTPVQLIAAFNALVNDGVYVKPTIDEKAQPVTRRLISTRTAEILKGMLRDVVEIGSGVKAKIDGKLVLGKTGTSQKPDKKDVTTLFTGYTELDGVGYSILVWIDNPQVEKMSSLIAAPFFKEVVEVMERYKKLHKPLENKAMIQLDEHDERVDLRGSNVQSLAEYAGVRGYKLRVSGNGLYVSDFRILSTPEGTCVEAFLSQLPPKLAVYEQRAQK